jgi:hypothetical protein
VIGLVLKLQEKGRYSVSISIVNRKESGKGKEAGEV